VLSVFSDKWATCEVFKLGNTLQNSVIFYEASYVEVLNLEAEQQLNDEPYFVCPVCGNTVAGEAPEKCPICGAPRSSFKRVE